MHREKVKYYDDKGKVQECEAETFDTVVHLLKGKAHALKDITCLLDEAKKGEESES